MTVKPDNAIEGADLQNMLQGVEMMQPASGTPGMSVIDSLKNHLGLDDGPAQVIQPAQAPKFDMNI